MLIQCPGHSVYATTYIDKIIIYSNDWQQHLKHLRTVLRLLRVVKLTANPQKCAIRSMEVQYLGFHLRHGKMHPQIYKTCPSPKTKKEVKQFLGLVLFYNLGFWQILTTFFRERSSFLRGL